MKFSKLIFKSFFRKNSFPSFPTRLSAGCSLFTLFFIHQYLNFRKPSSYLCNEEQLEKDPKQSSDPHILSKLKMFIAEKKLSRIYPLEGSTRPYKTYFNDGLKETLKIFDTYELYTHEKTLEKFINKQPLSPHEKPELGMICLLFKANEISQGHKHITHGGLMATVLDHMMGRVSEMCADGDKVATANLNINYRKPIVVGREYLMEVYFEKMENERKIFLRGRIMNENHDTCLDAHGLFLKVKWGKK